jgi:hypothetical protein
MDIKDNIIHLDQRRGKIKEANIGIKISKREPAINILPDEKVLIEDTHIDRDDKGNLVQISIKGSYKGVEKLWMVGLSSPWAIYFEIDGLGNLLGRERMDKEQFKKLKGIILKTCGKDITLWSNIKKIEKKINEFGTASLPELVDLM